MLFREIAGLARFNVDDSYDAVLGDERDRQLRADIGHGPM